MDKKQKNITAKEVAKYIVNAFQESGDPITNLKLQKLLYYVQGWHLGLFNKPIFNENFQAWVHGPVIPEIFQEYKKNGWNPIVKKVNCDSLPSNVIEHINDVLDVYGGDTGWSLELRTHKEQPWLNARGNLPPTEPSTKEITKDSMQSFFVNLAK